MAKRESPAGMLGSSLECESLEASALQTAMLRHLALWPALPTQWHPDSGSGAAAANRHPVQEVICAWKIPESPTAALKLTASTGFGEAAPAQILSGQLLENHWKQIPPSPSVAPMPPAKCSGPCLVGGFVAQQMCLPLLLRLRLPRLVLL